MNILLCLRNWSAQELWQLLDSVYEMMPLIIVDIVNQMEMKNSELWILSTEFLYYGAYHKLWLSGYFLF